MILGLCIFITLFTLSWVAYPLLFEYRRRRLPDALAVEQEASLLRALQTHYDSLDPEENREENEDFKNIERRLMLRLAKLYQTHDMAPSTVAGVQDQLADAALDDSADAHVDAELTDSTEAATRTSCHACGTSVLPEFVHCPACGTKL